MYSRRSTVNGFPMCVEGLKSISTYRHIRLAQSNFLVVVLPFCVITQDLQFPVASMIPQPVILNPTSLNYEQPTCYFWHSSSLYWIAKSVFWIQRNQSPPTTTNSHDNKKDSSIVDTHPPLTPDIIFIRNVWSKQKKHLPNITVVSFSVHSIPSSL